MNSSNTSIKNWKGWRKRALGVEDVTNVSYILSEDAKVIYLGRQRLLKSELDSKMSQVPSASTELDSLVSHLTSKGRFRTS